MTRGFEAEQTNSSNKFNIQVEDLESGLDKRQSKTGQGRRG